MIKIENVVLPSEEQWLAVIRGMRNPKNSWDKSEGNYVKVLAKKCDDCSSYKDETYEDCEDCPVDHLVSNAENHFMIGPNDHKLMMSLVDGGPVHAKYRRMIPVYLDITAPLYWWKEFDTYKVGTVSNSCSTMHKIADHEFTRDDFSCEHLMGDNCIPDHAYQSATYILDSVIKSLNFWREEYLTGSEAGLKGDKEVWWQMIQLLPSSYNQRRTIFLTYEALYNMYHSRKNHKLDEWREFCAWIESLPYSELITTPQKRSLNVDRIKQTLNKLYGCESNNLTEDEKIKYEQELKVYEIALEIVEKLEEE